MTGYSYRRIDGWFLCFALDDAKSFESLSGWLGFIACFKDRRVVDLLVGLRGGAKCKLL